MRTLRPSNHPRFSSPSRNPARRAFASGWSSAMPISTPIRRTREVAEDDHAVAWHVHWLFVLHHKFAPHIKNLFDQFIDFRGIQGQDQSRPVFNVNYEPNAAAIFCDRELQLAVNHGSSGRALLEKTIAGLSSSRGDEFYELKPKPLGGGIIHRKRRCCAWPLNIENHSIRPSQPDTNLGF